MIATSYTAMKRFIIIIFLFKFLNAYSQDDTKKVTPVIQGNYVISTAFSDVNNITHFWYNPQAGIRFGERIILLGPGFDEEGNFTGGKLSYRKEYPNTFYHTLFFFYSDIYVTGSRKDFKYYNTYHSDYETTKMVDSEYGFSIGIGFIFKVKHFYFGNSFSVGSFIQTSGLTNGDDSYDDFNMDFGLHMISFIGFNFGNKK